jgi:hypothetical protein
MKRMTPEGALLCAVKDLLTAERVWFCRMNTGSLALGEGQSRRYFQAGRKGMADIMAVRKTVYPAHGSGLLLFHRVLWLELKSPKGVQSDAQKEFQQEVEAQGHVYLLIRDVREVQTWLKESA